MLFRLFFCTIIMLISTFCNFVFSQDTYRGAKQHVSGHSAKLSAEKLSQDPIKKRYIFQDIMISKKSTILNRAVNDISVPPSLGLSSFVFGMGDDCSNAVSIQSPALLTPELLGGALPMKSLGPMGDISLLSHSQSRPYPNCNFVDDFNDPSQGTVDCFYRMRSLPGTGACCVRSIINIEFSSFGSNTTRSVLYLQPYISSTTGGDCGTLTKFGECKPIAHYDGSTIFDGYPVNFEIPADANVVFRLFSYTDNVLIWSDQWRLEDIEIMALPTPAQNEDCSRLFNQNGCNLAQQSGCNIAAPSEKDRWAGPSQDTRSTPPGAGILCGGSQWLYNSAPYYHCFVASQNNPSISFRNIACSRSNGLSLKLAAFTNCSVMDGTANMWSPNNFKGCNTGSVQGEVTLQTTGINAGDSFIVVVDTEECNFCTWEYNATGVLPLGLVDFKVINNGKENIITWETTQEREISKINLERSSDGVNFSPIASYNALNGVNTNKYNHTDFEPNVGTNYYRLNFVSIDGTDTEYSKIISVNHYSNKFLIHKIQPNPAKDILSVSLESPVETIIGLQLIDAKGKLVRAFQYGANQGFNTYEIDASNFPNGIYHLRFQLGSSVIIEKIAIMK